MPSPFTLLPQDMLQWEISRFLDPVSRADFNAVLKPDEHVYKKLPKDFAIKHDIEIKRAKYKSMMMRLNYYMNLFDLDYETAKKRALIKAELLKNIWTFLRNPLNANIFAHSNGLKEKMIGMVHEWMVEDVDFYDYLADRGFELRTLAKETCVVIASRPFLYEINVSRA
jgi:hypothetical protein